VTMQLIKFTAVGYSMMQHSVTHRYQKTWPACHSHTNPRTECINQTRHIYLNLRIQLW